MAPLSGHAAAPQPRLLLLPAAVAAAAPGSSAASSSSPPPRKRQRLAHLSAEEKALRRKLKNRVAAQSARDRKKARMGELERQAVELEAENQRLLAENQALRGRTLSLAAENRELRLRLGLPAPEAAPKVEATAEPPAAGRGEEEDATSEEEEEEEASERGLGPATGSAESAAGTGPAVAPLGCLRLDPDGGAGALAAESDLLLGILDSLDPDLFLHYAGPELACWETLQQEQQPQQPGEADPLPASSCPPLGPSPPRLEAINELIRFDHEYTKPFVLEVASEEISQAQMLERVEAVAPFPSEQGLLGAPLPVKEEPLDVLLPELGISHLLSSGHKPLVDAASDSGYEGSPSPFSDLSSPLGTDYAWDEAFANELFPQLISV